MITPTIIIDYLNTKFGDNYKIAGGGNEYVINSPFEEDDNYHCSINLQTGLWQDFKSGLRGNFIQFVARVEDKNYKRIEGEFAFKSLMSEKELEIELKPAKKEEELEDLPALLRKWTPINIHAPELYQRFNIIDEDQIKGLLYVIERKLLDLEVEEDQFFVGRFGKAESLRLVIPFFFNGELVFYQARDLEDQKPKYLNAKSIKAAHILYPYDTLADSVVVCEGPIDAISLQRSGVNATSIQGSFCSIVQMEMLGTNPGMEIILGFDADKAGEKAIRAFEKLRKKKNIRNPPSICPPPPGFKDWNAALVGGIDLQPYVNKCKQELSFDYLINADLSLDLSELYNERDRYKSSRPKD